MNSILYFPYINLPQTAWALRTLLYYDNVGSIVPQEFVDNPESSFDPHMWRMIREGLVTPLNPLVELSAPWGIGRPFLKFIEGGKFPLKRRRAMFREEKGYSIHNDKFRGRRIHSDKFGDNVLYDLKELGLARKVNETWYDVEKKTASYLMEYLASVMSVKLNRRAVTDKARISRFRNSDFITEDRRREIVLKRLIPFPQNVSLDEVIDLKMRFPDLLSSFRVRVEDIALDETLEIGSDRLSGRIKELEEYKGEL